MMCASSFLIPPRRFDTHGGFLSLPPHSVLTLTAPVACPHALRVVEPILPTGAERRMVLGSAYTIALGAPNLEAKLAALAQPLSPDGFTFVITPEGFAACATSAEGLFRGCAFLRRECRAGRLPCGEGEDAPEKAVRGLMLDVSRNRVYSVETLFHVVDMMVLLGMNRLELYFENVFAYRNHEAVWAKTSPYTPEDIAAVEAYCAARFVQLVPNQNTLGHFERWLKHPEYLRYAELPQGGARTPWGAIQAHPTGLFAADRATRDFVKGLLEELLPCFPRATSVNLGGDEVFDLGQGRSQTDDKATLYLGYMREMADVALRQGKRPELWADMLIRHPEILPQVKSVLPEVRWLVWGYEATDPIGEYAARLRAEGLEVVVCPGTSSWRSFCGRTSNMLANIRAAAQADASGMLLTDWGDAGHWQPLTVSIPALAFAGALAWNTHGEPNLPALTDVLLGEEGLGDLLLRLGDTYLTAEALAGNATKLFQAYNLPLADGPALKPEALEKTLVELEELAEAPVLSGHSLAVREALYALELQRLAVLRALKKPGLRRMRAALAAQMTLLWAERGPRAQLDDSLSAFLAQELPE